MSRAALPYVVASLALLLAAGCGGSGGSKDAGNGSSASGGKALFEQSCKGCHTLADASAAGTAGPNLDDLKPTEEQVRKAVVDGKGGMPAGLYKGADADEVAKYVASVAGGGSSTDDDTTGSNDGDTTASTTGTTTG